MILVQKQRLGPHPKGRAGYHFVSLDQTNRPNPNPNLFMLGFPHGVALLLAHLGYGQRLSVDRRAARRCGGHHHMCRRHTLNLPLPQK